MEEEKIIIFDIKEKKGKTKLELEQLLKFWQEKLKMEDWKLDLKIVDFKRKSGFRQSGDFIADPVEKTASILMTWDPWRGDEEYTLVHEMIHVIFYGYDKCCEDLILKYSKDKDKEVDSYMEFLENTVHQFTWIVLGRNNKLSIF